jgi:hypothetical protein
VFVMGWGMIFCEIFCDSVGAFTPMYDELALFDTIAYPIGTHVDGFLSALFDSFVGDTGRTRIVYLNWRDFLVVAYFDESGAEWYAVSCIMEK